MHTFKKAKEQSAVVIIKFLDIITNYITEDTEL